MTNQISSHSGASDSHSSGLSYDNHQQLLEVGPNRVALTLVTIALFALLFPLLLGVWFIPQFMFSSDVSTWTRVLAAAHWFVATLLVPLALGVAFTCLIDAMRPSPILKIDQDGLFDARAGIAIGWNSIVRARIGHHRYGIAHVALTLDRPLLAHRNPMRLGGGLQWRRRSNRLCVPLMLLDQKADVIAGTIMNFVSAHGGDVSSTRL
ncbi:hypothetical protein LJR237_001484 [Bosea sp. LjRoot237]